MARFVLLSTHLFKMSHLQQKWSPGLLRVFFSFCSRSLSLTRLHCWPKVLTWKETKSQPSPDKTDCITLKLRVGLMGGGGLLPAPATAPPGSRDLSGSPSLGPPGGAERVYEGKWIFSGNFWGKERSSTSFSGSYNDLKYSCFATPIRAWQTMCRIAYQETKARKPAVQPRVEICFCAWLGVQPGHQ